MVYSFKKFDSKCCISGRNAEIVHHLYPFHKIIKEAHENLSVAVKPAVGEYFDAGELAALEEECLRLHYEHGLGVPLAKQLHKLFHKEYGNRKCNAEDFEEFKIRCKNGEFCDITAKHGEIAA